MSKEKLRVASIGLGKMGLLHSCILNVMPGVELAALCEQSRIIRRFFKKLFNQVPIVDDVEKLAESNLDAVYITTPIPSHFSIAKIIYEKEIARNLFIEKTLASSYEEAKQLYELAKRFRSVNMVGYMRRFAVTFKKAKELLEEDAIGHVNSFKAYAFSSDFYESKKGLKAPGARGGVLEDLGYHVIDIALWFFGDLKISSAKLGFIIGNDSEDSAHFEIRNSRNVEGVFDISWCMKNYRMPEVGLTISGSGGTLLVSDDKVELRPNNGSLSTWFRHDLNDTVFYWLGGPEYFREDESFVKSIIEGGKAEPDFYTASQVDEVIDQVKKSY